MAQISQKTIDLIKDTADIVDVVSEFVPLQTAGKNMKGLCPFHSEKTPSFFVSKERQIFNCFGCGKKGNAITFVQEYKHLSFVEAVEFLADKYNIPLEIDENNSNIRQTTDLYKANEMANKYFNLNLLNIDSGKLALDYLLDRGLNFETIERFELGYAPNKGNGLFDQLSKDFQPLDLINVGLINRNSDGGYYDLFRSRIMFPIRDENNKLVAFSGRTFGDSANPAKYVNTPYTEIFSKGTILYNLYKALPYVRTENHIILMEGYMDVIKASMAGVNEVVCSMGTQLTIDQAILIKKYTDNVIICYDGDKAGQEASYKAIKLLEKAKLNVKVVSLPDGMDPDEYITKKPDFKSYLDKNQLDQYEFVYQMIVKHKDFSSPAIIEEVKNKLFDFFGKTSGMIREIYFKRFASEAGVGYNTLIGDYQQSRIDEQIMENYKAKINRVITHKVLMPKYEKAESTVLNYYLKSSEYREIIESRYNLLYFHNMDIRVLMFSARDAIKQNSKNPILILKSGLGEKTKNKLDEYLYDEYDYNIEDLDSCIITLEIAMLQEDKQSLEEQASQFYADGNINKSLELSDKAKDKQKKILELEGRYNGQKSNY